MPNRDTTLTVMIAPPIASDRRSVLCEMRMRHYGWPSDELYRPGI